MAANDCHRAEVGLIQIREIQEKASSSVFLLNFQIKNPFNYLSCHGININHSGALLRGRQAHVLWEFTLICYIFFFSSCTHQVPEAAAVCLLWNARRSEKFYTPLSVWAAMTIEPWWRYRRVSLTKSFHILFRVSSFPGKVAGCLAQGLSPLI